MSRKIAWLATPLLLAWVHLAEAQQLTKTPRVRFLGPGSRASYAARIEHSGNTAGTWIY